jgi:hypothetical protein
MFDDGRVRELSAQVTEGFAALSRPALVPVLPVLHEVIPEAGLRPGTITSVEGSAALALALTAGLGERWCALVGLPEAYVTAAATMGAAADGVRTKYGLDPTRVLLVDHPARRWADVIAALTDGCAMVLTRPPERPAPQVTRRLTTLARRNGCALVVAGPWAGADLHLRVEESHWTGLGTGTGHLRSRRALITSHGRGAAGLGRQTWLWLPAADGSVSLAEQTVSRRTLTAAV